MSVWLQPEPFNWRSIVDGAVAEDVGSGDLTSGVLDPTQTVQWYIEAQQDGVLCGAGIVQYLFGAGESLAHFAFPDGSSIASGDRVAHGIAPVAHALTIERTALNFLMHLSGVATLTQQFVRQIEGTGAKIVDTRKTLPLLRTLQKYAVRCGGGYNHRMGLYDGAMLKDNHVKAAGSISEAVKAYRSYASHMTKIEVECETLEQVDEAVAAGADVVLLDNMEPAMMRDAVQKNRGKCLFEASGGVQLSTVRKIAESGVDLISVGALTHSAPSVAFHMELS